MVLAAATSAPGLGRTLRCANFVGAGGGWCGSVMPHLLAPLLVRECGLLWLRATLCTMRGRTPSGEMGSTAGTAAAALHQAAARSASAAAQPAWPQSLDSCCGVFEDPPQLHAGLWSESDHARASVAGKGPQPRYVRAPRGWLTAKGACVFNECGMLPTRCIAQMAHGSKLREACRNDACRMSLRRPICTSSGVQAE